MAYTYILLSKVAKKTYVGSTLDLENRIAEHSAGKSTFTSRYLPWQLVYSGKLDSIQEARKREKYFKSAAGRAFMRKHIPRPA